MPADADRLLKDPALLDALSQSATFGRLSDDDARAMRRTRRSRGIAGATAVLTLLIGTGIWSTGTFRVSTQHFETARGQQLTVALADGTKLQLNGSTSLDVRLESGQRLVEMAQGEVYFDVAHDARRPFIVHAGGSGTQVLGTAFDIDMARGQVKLAVYRGKVRFGDTDGKSSSVLVPAGWRSRFDGRGARTPERFDAAQLDWRQSWLDTDDMQLRDLVDTLNRTSGLLILPPPERLAHIPLSGRFKLDNPFQLLSAIGEAYGFSATREGNRIRLIEAPAADLKPS